MVDILRVSGFAHSGKFQRGSSRWAQGFTTFSTFFTLKSCRYLMRVPSDVVELGKNMQF